LRELAPRVLGRLIRHHGPFDTCEDAVQEALLAAARQWPKDGVPDHPESWLLTVASRRLIDAVRSDTARRRREDSVAVAADFGDIVAPGGEAVPSGRDDTLTLLFLCCHPALTPPSQLALTLRAVGGLTTSEAARAFLVPEETMTRRITRAKQQIREHGARFEAPGGHEWDERLQVVLHVLYLIYNEGYMATAGPSASRPDLTAEAVRLTRMVHAVLPDNGEVAGLLALMLLTDARRPARTGPDGNLVPLAEQDRSLWDRRLIDEGIRLISDALASAPLGPYQLQAAIAAIHAEAADARDTDWRQIVALYDLLERMSPSPVVSLNRAVAVAMVDGAEAGLDLLVELEDDRRIATTHRFAAVRAHLQERAKDLTAAATNYRTAARQATSLPERRYLEAQAARLARARDT
jgi:RNA polymerase sigma factor (sigma-70 family)